MEKSYRVALSSLLTPIAAAALACSRIVAVFVARAFARFTFACAAQFAIKTGIFGQPEPEVH